MFDKNRGGDIIFKIELISDSDMKIEINMALS